MLLECCPRLLFQVGRHSVILNLIGGVSYSHKMDAKTSIRSVIIGLLIAMLPLLFLSSATTVDAKPNSVAQQDSEFLNSWHFFTWNSSAWLNDPSQGTAHIGQFMGHQPPSVLILAAHPPQLKSLPINM